MKKIFFAFIIALAAFLPAVSFAGEKSAIQQAIGRLGITSDTAQLESGDEKTVSNLISTGINTIIGILGVVAVLLIVYAGGLWLTAAGNETKVEDAKKIIKSTIIGIVIISLAYAITTFVITIVTPAPAPPQQNQELPAAGDGLPGGAVDLSPQENGSSFQGLFNGPASQIIPPVQPGQTTIPPQLLD